MNKLFGALAIPAMLAGAAEAQDTAPGIEAGISTLGFFVSGDMPVADRVRLRLPVYLGSYSDDFDFEGNTVNGSLDVTAAHVMADYYVGNSGLRVSGGLSFGGYKAEANAPNSLTLDGTTYNANFNLTMDQERDIAPVLAVGYQRTFGSNWGISVELGARITSLRVSATGQEALSAADRASFESDLADVNNDLNVIGAIPFLSLGASFRF